MRVQLASLIFVICSSTRSNASRELETCPEGADELDCKVGIPDYSKCDPEDVVCGGSKNTTRRALSAQEREVRRLQLLKKTPVVQYVTPYNLPLPYDRPCYSPTRNELMSNWTLWNQVEDGSEKVDLNFDFGFFGRIYKSLFVADNGFLSFENTFRNNYQPTSFPSGLSTPMIAPFWADVEVAVNGNRGSIYYKDFGETFAVIWDEVGYYTGTDSPSSTHNSFQVVISKTGNAWIPDLDNICFCYLDMGWSHGDRDGVGGFQRTPGGITRAATVGITNGYPDPSLQYSQIGRFNETGNTFRGVSVPSGVNFLDFLGSYKNENPRHGFCFNTNPNLAPTFIAGPTNGTIDIPCGGSLDEFKFYFAGPELDQILLLDFDKIIEPLPTPTGLTASIDGIELPPTDKVGIRLMWENVDFAIYGGQTFVYEFTVCDNHPANPLCTTAKITINVAQCFPSSAPSTAPGPINPAPGPGPVDDCIPHKCHPLPDNQCSANIGPVCTPWRSPELCDPMFSFPMLISSRYPMIKHDSETLAQDGWWFQYTDDRASAYSFTRSANEAAPELYCCVTSVDDLLGPAGNPSASACFDGSPVSWTDAYVIRAEGHHSGQGVFVLPSGLDVVTGGVTTELVAGVGPVSLAQVRGYLNDLEPAPKKFVVEKFIAGSGTGANAILPNEYKFHMFNGKIGSITTFLNRGTDCACYGEYSENWECLHTNGCFVPGFPMGQAADDQNCFDIDFDAGEKNPYPVKGFDLCGPVSAPDKCIFDLMKEIAVKLSLLIGVYVRIDMFVTDNNEIYIQEYTFNHMGGTRHCSSKKSSSGCIDSCFLGKMWQEASENGGDATFGGPKTTIPQVFTNGYGTKTDSEQCSIAMGQTSFASPSYC